MASSETTGGAVDCSVGSIVWVRRRNGSWWPGKILGPEDLSSSHITTPRSGTPVKLLGREDASVDWYNLEKSKRVKAFRCGEFNDCIERAEASQGMPPKKREKYARREDAIMHALELERQMSEKKYGKLGNPSNKRHKRSPDAVTSSEILENGAGSKKDLRFVKVENNVTEQHLFHETVKDANQLSGDDESAGALPRMRGLQDFGLRTAPPPREDLSGIIGSRAKRSRYAYSPYDSGDYVLDNQTLSSQVEIPVSKLEEDSEHHPHDADEDRKTGSTEDTETDCSISDSLESDSDDEMTGLSDESASIELRPKYPRRIDGDENHGSFTSSDDMDDSSYGDEPETYGREASKHLKGKRNITSTRKRYPHSTDIEAPRTRMNGVKNSGFRSVYTEKNFRSHAKTYKSTGLNSYDHSVADMEGSAWNNQTNGFWDHSMPGKCAPGGMNLLLDAQFRVEANNYPKDTPLVSLISKINGHAIIGHPIKVEVLDSTGDGPFLPQPLRSLTPLPSMWKTGRRTANPRGRRSFSFLAPQFPEQDGNFPHGPLGIGNFGHDTSNLKTRMLSSIASAEEQYIPGVDEGLLPKEEYVPGVVASVPVSLVFGRLHEELNR